MGDLLVRKLHKSNVSRASSFGRLRKCWKDGDKEVLVKKDFHEDVRVCVGDKNE